MTQLLDHLRQLLRVPDALLARGDRVLVAVSGGPDSLALLHALLALREELGLADVSAAHFHHGLRGPEADSDADFMQDFCTAQGIACFVEHGDVRADAARAHLSIQQAARAARYEFLARTANACGANKVATGHTQDDQTETVLLNILRGTGVLGLRGIPRRRGIFVRPLIHTTRAQVEDYCAAHSLHPRQDTSNHDPSHYMRNRIRHELLPLLAREYAPGVRGALLRLSEIATADTDFLQAHAQETLRAVTLAESAPHGLTLSRDALTTLHPGLLPHVLRAAFKHMRGTAEGIAHHHLMQIAEALSLPKKRRWGMTTPAPLCRVLVGSEVVNIISGQEDVPTQVEMFSALLAVGGSMTVIGSSWQVQATLAENPVAAGEWQAVFDASEVDLPSLHVRGWRPGDRIAPRGLAGHTQKLQDIFTNAKVPRARRAQIPLVADSKGLLWVAGLACSGRGAITPQTRLVLTLTASADPLPGAE